MDDDDGDHHHDDRRAGGEGLPRGRLGGDVHRRNVVSDIAAGIRDVVERSGSCESTTAAGRREAVDDIGAEAAELGADAVVGATFDYVEMRKGMPWIDLSGTAVETARS